MVRYAGSSRAGPETGLFRYQLGLSGLGWWATWRGADVIYAPAPTSLDRIRLYE